METETQNDTNRENAEISKLVAEMINLISDARKKDAETMKLQIEAQTFKLRHALAAIIGTVVFLAALKALLPIL